MAVPDLPLTDALLVDAQFSGDVPLKQSEVESLLPQMVPKNNRQLLEPPGEPALRKDTERERDCGVVPI